MENPEINSPCVLSCNPFSACPFISSHGIGASHVLTRRGRTVQEDILRKGPHSCDSYHSMLLELFYFIVVIVNLLLYLTYELNFIIRMYVKEKQYI